ncbi:MAG TPA: GNAT family N-acetyltransferase [Candidatus Tumulicola sp.]
MTPSVRTGNAADWPFVSDLGRRTASSSIASVRPAPERFVVNAFDRLIDTIRAQSHVVLIAEVDGRPAGFLLMLDGLPDDVTGLPQAFVAYMAVEPQLQRSGIGAALLQAAERKAIELGLPYIALMVTEENTAAQALYGSGGYATERRLLSKRL